VLEGLYDPKEGIVKSDDELAAVIGHEIAHVTCRHSTEAMTRSMPYEIILGLTAIYAELDDNEDLQMIVGGAFLAYQGLIVTMHSRDNEFEADRVGMEYMARAGYNPEAAPRLWKRSYEKDGGTPKLLSILSTHPRDEDRVKNLEQALPAALEIYARTKGGRLEPAPRVITDEFGGAAAGQAVRP
jgi:metalloendopeptidase OMA1, mitochondrial